jgi:hypothetical protein
MIPVGSIDICCVVDMNFEALEISIARTIAKHTFPRYALVGPHLVAARHISNEMNGRQIMVITGKEADGSQYGTITHERGVQVTFVPEDADDVRRRAVRQRRRWRDATPTE